MIDAHDALGIYDRLKLIHMDLQNITSSISVMQEGIRQMDAGDGAPDGCMGVLYTLLDGATGALECVLLDYDKILEQEKMEVINNGL